MQKIFLNVPYSLDALAVVVSFAREASLYLGAQAQEAQACELAVEEAAVSIIEGLPKGYAGGDYFTIECLLEKEGVAFYLRNLGLPVDLQKLPQYSTDNPETSSDGLSLHLMSTLMDEVSFENRGHEGWQTRIWKSLEKVPASVPRESNEASSESGETVSYEVGLATPDMAYEVSKLTYHNYGYSYSKDKFYFPDQLSQMIQQKKVISIVATTPSKEIIGHLGLKPEEDVENMAEVMLAMVHPNYRGTRCFYRLSQALFSYCQESKLDCIYSGLVTKHIYSQKNAILFGMKPTAFRLSLHARAKYRDIDGDDLQRESLLDAFAFLCPTETWTIPVCLPTAHRSVITKTLGNLNLKWQELTSDNWMPHSESSSLDSCLQESIGLASIQVSRVGSDFIAELAKLTKSFCRKRIETIYLFLNLDEPAIFHLDAKLESLGFFYTGIRPNGIRKWQISYTYLNNQEFNYEAVKVADEFAKELLDYIASCERKSQNRQIEILN